MRYKYLKLLVFVEGISRPYLLTNSNMNLYSIISGDFYKGQTKIGKVVAFNVEHRIPTKLGEQPCSELKCENCPINFCCKQACEWSETPFDILKRQILNSKMSVKTYKFLYKELNQKYSK